MKIGTDVSVMATDGLKLLEPLTPSVTTFVSDENYVACCTMALFQQQLNGDSAPRIMHIKHQLKCGGSTAKCEETK